MKVSKFISLLIISLFLLASGVTTEYFVADTPQNAPNEIHLEWQVHNDSVLDAFEIKRKMSHDNDFARLSEVSILPVHVNPRTYTYIDRNVFKSTSNSEPVVYELYGRNQNGQLIALGQTEVNYTSTGIRRTWGSIKSMFQ